MMHETTIIFLDQQTMITKDPWPMFGDSFPISQTTCLDQESILLQIAEDNLLSRCMPMRISLFFRDKAMKGFGVNMCITITHVFSAGVLHA
jgi:hypothetical protein